MKKSMMAVAAGLFALNASAISLADANAKVVEASMDSAVMAQTIKEVPAADQTAYLSQVFAAIKALNEAPEKKAALFLNASKAALDNVAPENKADALAEIFANLPVEVLPLFIDQYGVEYVGREADPVKKVSDDVYAGETAKLMDKIDSKTSETDNGGVRDALAAIMLLKASGNPTDRLVDALLAEFSDEEARKLAKEDWIPAALGKDGAQPSYDSVLAAGDAGELPDAQRTLALADTTPMSGAFFANLATSGDETKDALPFIQTELDPNEWALPDSMFQTGLNAVPRTADPSNPWYSGYKRGSGKKGSNNAGESDGYAFQDTF